MELATFLSRLPAPHAVPGVSPQLVDAVMETLLAADTTPGGGLAIVASHNASLGGGG